MRHLSQTRRLWAALPLVAGVAITSAAHAQTIDPGALQRDPAVQAAVSACTSDRGRLCSGVLPGGGRIARCLASHGEALSPACRTAMEKASAALTAAGIAIAPTQPVK